MAWEIRINKRAVKNPRKIPVSIQEKFKAPALELRETGPVQDGWPNYGKIRGATDCHHCHIKKGKPTYVAVWITTGDGTVEVTYVGTHEGADYQRLC